jgi:hypothetical protein
MGVALRPAAFGLLLALLGCSTLRPPIVQTRIVETQAGLLRRVAVAPFQPRTGLEREPGPKAVSVADAADLVTRFVAEELGQQGIDVVAPNDLLIAFEATGSVLPREDAAAVAALAAEKFGATSVILGRVSRYREREGGASGSLRPASVGFELMLHAAPSGRLVYVARFDHTQEALSANLFSAMRYPGGGSRWLTAADLARWGAQHAVEEIPEGMR